MPDETTRFTCKGQNLYHFMGTSTFSEYTVLPEIAYAKINPKANMVGACLFGCGLSTGLGAGEYFTIFKIRNWLLSELF